MKYFRLLLAGAVLVGIYGCGGSGGSNVQGELSGIVQDVNGNVVRGANVFIDNGPQTFSNSSGAYVLRGVHGEQPLVRAQAFQDGIEYFGAQVSPVFQGERSKSVNITVVRTTQRAQIHGRVVDRNGFFIGGARIFAVAGGMLSSTIAISDSDGNFRLSQVVGDVSYQVVASARGYDSDTDTLTVPAGQDQEVLFTLSNASNAALPPPANFSAVAWTSPKEATRSHGQTGGLDAVKKLFDPRHAVRTTTRDTGLGNFVEVDLFWDPVNSLGLLGYGIYRRPGNTGQFTVIDYLRDPLSIIYEDNDDSIHEFQTYSYAVTSLNTTFPDNPPGDESALSTSYAVLTLSDLLLNPVTVGSPVQFNWQGGSGASSYVVYVFSTYPGVGITSLWNNSSSPTTNLSLNYGGPGLQSGHRYYYVVIGLANNGDSRTISRIDDFVAP